MFPGLHSRIMATVLTLGALWAVVLINLRGVKAAGLFAELMTYSKMIPFGAIAIIGLFYVDPTHFSEFNASGKPLLTATAAFAPLTMFAYLGLESATVPAGDVKDPERTIPRSTILGISIAMLLYVLGTIAVMGIVPREQLVKSVRRSPMRPRYSGDPGGNRDFHRRDPVVDWRSQWLDAPHGPGTHGGSARAVPAPLLDSPSKVCRLSGSSSRRSCRLSWC